MLLVGLFLKFLEFVRWTSINLVILFFRSSSQIQCFSLCDENLENDIFGFIEFLTWRRNWWVQTHHFSKIFISPEIFCKSSANCTIGWEPNHNRNRIMKQKCKVRISSFPSPPSKISSLDSYSSEIFKILRWIVVSIDNKIDIWFRCDCVMSDYLICNFKFPV